MNIVKCEKTIVVPKAFANAISKFCEDMLDCGFEDLTFEILEAIADNKDKIDDDCGYIRINYD